MYGVEEALDVLVDTALTDLIGAGLNKCVVPAFHLDRERECAEGPVEASRARIGRTTG